jgi:catechol 2,3-dioxygenase-like lactoylglutathione lyase family enzyme
VTATQQSTPRLAGIHHIKFPVSDLARSQRFYEMALSAKRVHQFDHRRPGDGTLFGIVMDIPGLGTFLELRLNPQQAAAQAGFDPITLAVEGRRDLDVWATHLDGFAIAHSPVLAGLAGWTMVTEDPDGLRIKYYTMETHGPEIPITWDERWLGPM